MGHLAKVGAEKANQAVQEGYANAKAEYPQVKAKVKGAYEKADKLASRGMDYAVRVRDNASESPLFRETERHEHSENMLFSSSHERRERKRKHKHGGGQSIVINVNSGGRKKKRRRNKRSGFSLI